MLPENTKANKMCVLTVANNQLRRNMWSVTESFRVYVLWTGKQKA